MKKLLSVLAAVMLVVGVTGQAMAAFELGNFQLVAYEEADSTAPVSNVGNEVHFDLGAGLDAIDGVTLDTGISLTNYSVSSWSQVAVGIFGGGYTPAYVPGDAFFASDTDDFTVSVASKNVFNSASMAVSSAFGPQDEIQAKATGTYYFNMGLSGSPTGSYAGMVDANSSFGAELLLADNAILEMGMYSFDGTTVTDLGTWTLDTTGANLMATYSTAAVPVPAAVWLLGSGLLGLIGIRRRNA